MFVKKATVEYHASAKLDDMLDVGMRCAAHWQLLGAVRKRVSCVAMAAGQWRAGLCACRYGHANGPPRCLPALRADV